MWRRSEYSVNSPSGIFGIKIFYLRFCLMISLRYPERFPSVLAKKVRSRKPDIYRGCIAYKGRRNFVNGSKYRVALSTFKIVYVSYTMNAFAALSDKMWNSVILFQKILKIRELLSIRKLFSYIYLLRRDI